MNVTTNRLLNWPTAVAAPRPIAPVSAPPLDVWVGTPAPAPAPAPTTVGTVGSFRSLKQDLTKLLGAAPQPAPAPAPAPAPQPPKPKAEKPKPKPKAEKPKPKPKPKPGPDYGAIASKLRKHLNNPYKGVTNQCFKYAWSMANGAGGKGIGGSTIMATGRGKGTAHVGTLVREGKIKVGDIIYINRKPQADPTSTILSYKPHWFVYIGKGQFADQYGVRGAQAMADAYPGRYIDQIYRSFK